MKILMPCNFPINLDDENEVEKWIELYKTVRGRRLANILGINGLGSTKAANALSNYAWNKKSAMTCRKVGMTETAKAYEEICERIYQRDIPLELHW